MTSCPTSGRAPSWISTLPSAAGQSIRPALADAKRVKPPLQRPANLCQVLRSTMVCMRSLQSAMVTITMPVIMGWRSKASTVRSITVRPASSANCFGTAKPALSPFPPARIIAVFLMSYTLIIVSPSRRGRMTCSTLSSLLTMSLKARMPRVWASWS